MALGSAIAFAVACLASMGLLDDLLLPGYFCVLFLFCVLRNLDTFCFCISICSLFLNDVYAFVGFINMKSQNDRT